MKVLSLFDGISCGQVALERSGIHVTEYFSSEINRFAVDVVSKHYPHTTQLGDVAQWKTWKLPKIDLLIGGSPCQGFSTAGKYLNFDDPRSVLFFKYVDVLRSIKPEYFIFENVVMDKSVEYAISYELGVTPVMLDSSLVSAQSRKRHYWTNINIKSIEDRLIYLDSVLDKSHIPHHKIQDKFYYQINEYVDKEWLTIGYSRKNGFLRELEKSLSVLASDYKGSSGLNRNQAQTAVVNTVSMTYRALNFLERERLQTLPEGYTDTLSNYQRYMTIGNGFTVDIIVEILRSLMCP